MNKNNPIFLSLGSNYTKEFILLSIKNIISIFTNQTFSEHKKFIDDFFIRTFGFSNTYYFYKSREAISFLLKNICKEGDVVATQAYTCFAVEKSIIDANLKVSFIDTEVNSPMLSIEDLKNKYKKEKFSVLIMQRTFGLDTRTKSIYELCKNHKIIVIEDLAQSFFSVSKDSKKIIGSEADYVVVSFGRDKILDTVSGGVLLSNSNYESYGNLPTVKTINVFKDSLYPFLTLIIRNTQHIYFGKLLSLFLRKIGLFKSPLYSPNNKETKLHSYYYPLLKYQIENLEKQISHRQKIARVYIDKIINFINKENSNLFLKSESNYLRFFINKKVSGDDFVILQKHGYYLKDWWYKNVVDCSNLNCHSSYKQGSCPNAEELVKNTFNLPTHLNVSEKEALNLANLVNKYIFTE